MTRSRQFRLLWHSVTIDLTRASSEVGGVLDYLVNDAEHGFAPVAAMTYQVNAQRDRFTVLEEGDLLDTVDSAHDVLDALYRRIHQRAFELASLRGWVRLHAATVDLPAARVLLTAPSGTGKTTVACTLRRQGVDVPADESTLVRHGIAVPVPRRFHVKPKTALPAEIEDLVAAAPALADGTVAALDPRSLGGGWAIDERRVDAFVLLERGDLTALREVSAISAMPALVEGCFRNQESATDALRALSVVGREARFFRLTVGDPQEVLAVLSRIDTDGRPVY